MTIVCPSCGLKNRGTATHCECGRALRDDGVDRGPPAPAVVRRKRSWRLVVAIAVAGVLGGIGIFRYVRSRSPMSFLRSFCGKRLDEQKQGDALLSRCKVRAGDHDVTIAVLHASDRILQLRIKVDHPSAEMASIRARAVELAGHFLDGDQLAGVRRSISNVVPAFGGNFREVVGGATISGATRLWVNAPDRRFVSLEVSLDKDYPIDGDHIAPGWPEGFGKVDGPVLERLRTSCHDEHAMSELAGSPASRRTWSTGDVWLTCELLGPRGLVSYQVVWNPQQRAVEINLMAAPDQIDLLLERIARPLLTEAQARWLAPDKRADRSAIEDGIEIDERTLGDAVSIEISAAPDLTRAAAR